MAVKKTTKKAKKEVTEIGDEASGGTSKARSIELAIKEIRTKFGDESIMTYGTTAPKAIESIQSSTIRYTRSFIFREV